MCILNFTSITLFKKELGQGPKKDYKKRQKCKELGDFITWSIKYR